MAKRYKEIEKPVKVDINRLKEAIASHGFLLEERARKVIKEEKWTDYGTLYFEDEDTQKSREIDICIYNMESLPVVEKVLQVIRWDLVIECKRTSQSLIFFSTPKNTYDEIKTYEAMGFFTIMNTIKEPNHQPRRIVDFLRLNELHHFFKNQNRVSNFASINIQNNYKLDTEDKLFKEYIVPLIKATNKMRLQVKNGAIKAYNEPFEGYRNHIFSFVHPVLLLDSDFFIASFKDGKIKIEPSQYIQMQIGYKSNALKGIFGVDVVSINYLQDYLQEIKMHQQNIGKEIQSKYPIILHHQTQCDFPDPKEALLF